MGRLERRPLRGARRELSVDLTVDHPPLDAPCDDQDDEQRFWHADLEVEVHAYDATVAITDHQLDRRWRVVVDGEVGIIAYVRPDAADRVVAALRHAHAG